MPELAIRAIREDDRLPPLTAFGMTLLLNLLCWVAIYGIARGAVWLWMLAQ